MRVESITSGGVQVHTVTGDMTFDHHAAVRPLVRRVGDAPEADHVIDLSAVRRVDAAGFGIMVMIGRALGGGGRSLTVRGARGEVRRFLDIARLDRIVPIRVAD